MATRMPTGDKSQIFDLWYGQNRKLARGLAQIHADQASHLRVSAPIRGLLNIEIVAGNKPYQILAAVIFRHGQDAPRSHPVYPWFFPRLCRRICGRNSASRRGDFLIKLPTLRTREERGSGVSSPVDKRIAALFQVNS
ncbi:MAG: hypothetical protein HQ518_14815 [Rhodopirellula sp.]|nr:hypothetical protein [Rhodopirellula sp.]